MSEDAGFAVTTAGSEDSTGDAAIEALANEGDIELILMDIELNADVDGSELASRLNEIRSVPVVFLTKHTEERFAREEFTEYVHPEDRKKTLEAVSEMLESGDTVRGLVNRQKTVRGWRTYEWNGAPIEEAGRIVGFQATGRDITEREESQRQLRLKNHAIEGSANGIVFADLDKRISYANRAALRLWNYDSLREVAGRPAAELTISAVRAEEGEMTAFMAIIVDVTERTKREAEIRELLQQKEVLLVELRHRIKNDLNLVRSLLLLQADQSENDATVTSLNEASDRLTVLAQVYDKVSADSDTDAEGTLQLRARDNGPGFPPEVLRGEVEGYGLTVIRELVAQHRGELSLSNDNGAVVQITDLTAL